MSFVGTQCQTRLYLNVLFLPFNFLVLFLVLYHLMVSSDSCPKGCSCSETKLDCLNPTFPIYLPYGFIEDMRIRGNISRIPTNAFVQPRETTVKDLGIFDSEISRIDSKAFNNVRVYNFGFSATKIKHLSSRVFYNFKCDNRFLISQTEMDVIPTSLFEGLTTGDFTISRSNITTFQTDAFKSASIRENFELNSNNINTVQKNAFPPFLVPDYFAKNSFYNNELQCSCGLVWMWEDYSPFKEFLKNNTCIWPNGTKTYMHKIDKSILCKDVDVTHTSEIWEQPTTISHRVTTTAAATTTTKTVAEATTASTSTTTTTAPPPPTTSYSCPAGCSCSESKLYCLNPTFPIYLPSGLIKEMNIRGSISKIPANAFVQPKETTVEMLKIYDSEISRIDSNAFNELRIGKFVLTESKIKYLSPRIFPNLTCHTVYIYDAEIDVMPTSLFEGLTTIDLRIFRNKIMTLKTDAFKSASIRKVVYITGNKINTVERNAFRAKASFNIRENKIKKFLTQDSVVMDGFVSNKLQCSCDLVWMWEDDSPFKDLLDGNVCFLPNGLKAEMYWIDKSTLCKV